MKGSSQLETLYRKVNGREQLLTIVLVENVVVQTTVTEIL